MAARQTPDDVKAQVKQEEQSVQVLDLLHHAAAVVVAAQHVAGTPDVVGEGGADLVRIG
jgi:hypothetical protein